MKYDVVIVGGGWAGTSAAISAARHSAKVLLVEKSGFLGGTSANSLVIPFMPYFTNINGEKVLLSNGIFTEIRERLYRYGGNKTLDGGVFNVEILKVVLDDLMKENNVDVLFHATLHHVNKDGNRIKSLVFTSTSEDIEIEADYFIDTTGNADLAFKAGFKTNLGRESDNKCQPMTLCFWISGVNTNEVMSHQKEISDIYIKAKKEGKIKNPREDVLMFHHIDEHTVMFNSTRVIGLSPVNAFDKSKAETIARAQMYELYSFLKENSPYFKNSTLMISGSEIGIRESRMIEGLYKLTVEDIKNCTKFNDSIAACNYDIDMHNPDGGGTSHYFFKEGTYYTIPYRCLIPINSENLLVAGRCISSEHEAQASFRIMPTCASLGQAAGTAIALANKYKINVDSVDIDILQKTLRNDHHFC